MRRPLALSRRSLRSVEGADACAVCGGEAGIPLKDLSGNSCNFCGLVTFHAGPSQTDRRERLIRAHFNRPAKVWSRFLRYRDMAVGGELAILADAPLVQEQAIRDVSMGFGMTPKVMQSPDLGVSTAHQIYCPFQFELSEDIETLATFLSRAMAPGGILLIESLIVTGATLRHGKLMGLKTLPTIANLSHLMERKGCQLARKERSRRQPIASLLYRKASF